MKATNIHITCKSFSEKEAVFCVLEGFGFKHFGQDSVLTNVQLTDDGDYQTWAIRPIGEQLTYKQFMEKYAMTELQKTIEAAKKQGYTNKTLSNALGKYDGYIARIISKPQSEKLQKLLIKEINELLVPATIDDAMMISKAEYDSLKKELSHKNQVLDKRNDKYNLLEGEFNKLTQDKEGLIRTINELEQQNKRVVDSNFELNDAISLRDATIDTLSKKLDASYENYSTRSAMHITAENKLKKERFWFVGITVALLVLFVGYYFVFNT